MLTLPPPEALSAARPGRPGDGPPPAASWSVVARFHADGLPGAAEVRSVLDEVWRARHHHPQLSASVPGGWRPLGDGEGAAVPRLKLTWDLGRTGVAPPSEADLKGRVGAVERALQQLAPCELQSSLPVPVAAERARALARLRRSWGDALLLRLVGGERGIDAAGCWFHLRDLGFRAGDDGWLHYGIDDVEHPPAISVGTTGTPRRLEPALMTMGDLRLSDVVFRFQPALCPRPRLLVESTLDLAQGLAAALSAKVLDGELQPLKPERLFGHADLVDAGLRRHGLTPGNSATVWIFGRS